MGLSLKPQHLKRYKDIALLFLKYGNADMVQQFGLRSALNDDDLSTGQTSPPEELANDLERMGPTFVKLGQLLSSRADLLPKVYLEALSRLQDKVKPFSYEEVETIVTSELGVRISKAFLRFDREPEAAASLGQVHRAVLRDGRQVVVKVQRPDIRQQIAEDLEVLEEITDFFEKHTKMGRRYQFAKIFDEFQKSLIQELDYLREAGNLTSIGENLKEFPGIVVPSPIANYTTRAVLTMDFIPGKKITQIEPLERMELKGAPLADELFKAYLKQVLVDGLFHADPHPGNVFLMEDHRLALLDLGMVGRTTPAMQEKLIKVLIAISEGKGEEAVAFVIEMSETTPYFDETEFRRKIAGMVAEQQNTTLDRMDIGQILLEVGRSAGENGLFVPIELTLLGKTLLQLDQIGRGLDDKFNPNAAIRQHVAEILNRRLKRDMTPGSVLGSLLDLKDFVSGLPRRVNKVLDAVGASELEIKVRSPDTNLLLEGFQKIANRITTGLILAALIIGAALLMQVRTSFQILGYPGFAMLCFLAAGGGGFWLVFSIALADQKTKRRQRRANKN
ncbi:MAG: AarF/UbiB family protein [Verrucomicrobiota bacterium]